MKAKDRLSRPLAWALFLLVALAGEVRASAPGLLTYQGRLKESGLPVTGVRSVDIQICGAPTGGVCTPTGAQGVSVVNGLFRTTFTVPSGIALETGNWFVEVHVGASAFSPREMLSAGAYAIYSSSASTLIANPGANYVGISTPVSFAAQDAAGYSVLLSSGLSTPFGTVKAKYFVGDGSGLTGLPSSTDITKVFKSGDSMTGPLNLVGVALNLTGAGGNVVSAASVTASSFWGDGAHLTGVTASGAVSKTGDGMTGPLTLSGSTLTVTGSAFSVGGSTFVVKGGQVGIGVAAPPAGAYLQVNTAADGLFDRIAILGPTNSTTQGFEISQPVRTWQIGQNLGNFGDGRLQIYDGSLGVYRAVFLGTGDVNLGGVDAQTNPGLVIDSSGNASFGSGAVRSTITAAGGLFVASGSSLTLSGAGGYVTTPSSVTASSFFGDGSHLTGVVSGAAVQKAGDAMTGMLTALSSFTVSGGSMTLLNAPLVMGNGVLIASGAVDVAGLPTGLGTRLMWVPSKAAIRAGALTASGVAWDIGNIGANSTAFGADGLASGVGSTVGGGVLNSATAIYSTVGGGSNNTAANSYATVPGGFLNSALGTTSFAAGLNAHANANGSFVWADSTGGAFNSGIQDQFRARAQGGFDVEASSFIFSNGASTYVYVDNGGLTMAPGSSITLSGAGGSIGTQSSVTASAFFGDGSHLGGIVASGGVLKTGDGMTGSLTMLGASTITVQGNAFSVGGSMFIVTGGNVGIGIGAPTAALHVSTTGPAGVRVETAGSDMTNPFIFLRDNGKGLNGLITSVDPTSGLNALHVGVSGALPLSLGTGGATRLFVQPAGNVGVGTTAPAALLDVSGNSQFGSGAAKSTFSALGSLFMAGGSSITLSGVGGVIVTQSSITAGTYYGDASHLTGVIAPGAVSKTGDTMTGDLLLSGSTLTVNGPIFSSGASGGTSLSGPGTRFMWVPSSAAIRAGFINGTQWDAANIGVYSVAFGQNGTASNTGASVAGGFGNTASGLYSTIGGGLSNIASGAYSSVPGGSSNLANSLYSFAAGNRAKANMTGDFVWADSQNVDATSAVQDQFLVRAQGGFVVQSSSFVFSNGVSTYVYVDSAGLAMAPGSSITLSGLGGVIVTQSSITAGTYYGDASHLTGVIAPGAVSKTGDTMTGDLTISNSTLTVSGPILSVGALGGTNLSGAGTRFMWVPSSGAIRAGQVAGAQWDPGSIGLQSVAFGYSPTASGAWSFVGGGQFGNASGSRSVVAGGDSNTASNTAAAVGGGTSNTASGIGAVVPGGYSNQAAGDYSFAGGHSASAPQIGAFVWASGSAGTPFSSTVAEEVAFRANGGVRFVTGTSTFSITPGGSVGIGAASPAATLHISSGNLLMDGNSGQAAIPGAGTRFEWIPSSAAVRGGQVAGTRWDPANIGPYSVAFGQDTQASGYNTVVSGGQNNVSQGVGSVVAGGITNSATNGGAAVGGGSGNSAIGGYATVPGGSNNQANGLYSFAAGNNAIAATSGVFAWADSQAGAFSVNTADYFGLRAQGGFGVYGTGGASRLVVDAAGKVGISTGVPAYDLSLGFGQKTLGVEDGSSGSTITIRSGSGASGGGGAVILQAGSASGAAGAGGSISLIPGIAVTGAPGSVHIVGANSGAAHLKVSQFAMGTLTPSCGTATIGTSAGSTDMSGTFTLNTNATPSAPCTVVVNFNRAYANTTPLKVFVTANDDVTAGCQPYAFAAAPPNSASLTIGCHIGPAPSTTLTFSYLVIE